MNKLYLLIQFMLTLQLTYSQTKLCILGTLHNETSKINSQSIYQAINNFKPDIILYEADTVLDIRNNLKGLDAIEFKSIHNYLKLNPKTQILPYDWTGKQKFREKNNYWARIDSMNSLLNIYFSTGHADKLSVTMLEAFSDLSSIENELHKEDIETINKPSARKLVELKSKWEYKKLIDMAVSNDTLKKIVPIMQMAQDYWEIRNKEMAQNILMVIKQYPNKRILVQTGNAHKFFIYNELENKQINNNYDIIEYWEE